MFDLHMHTNLSDGELSVSQLVKRLKAKNINLFSITDHNHALAYNYLENVNIKYLTGCELATSYNGTIIEILGYNVDVEIINNWYYDFHREDNLIENENKLFLELKQLATKLDFELSDNLAMEKIEKGVSKKTVYYDLINNNSNFEFATYKEFFRAGLSNPESEWFIDEGRYYPSIPEVIDLIHQAEGVAILAHPYEYEIDDLKSLFEYLMDLNIDGIECFHPSASMVNSVKLVKFCSEHNLLGSGGSDFHRDQRLIPNGVYIHDEVLEYKCFDWLREYLK